jgi:hypothetical protein
VSAKDDALKPIQNLQKRLQEVAKSLDLEVETFLYRPATGDMPDIFQVQLIIRAEAVMSEAEKDQKRIDAQFEEMEKALMQDDIAENKLPQIERDIQDWFELPPSED